MAQPFLPHSKTITRFSEPSTWAGIATMLMAFNVIQPTDAESIIAGGSGLAGLLAVFMREKK